MANSVTTYMQHPNHMLHLRNWTFHGETEHFTKHFMYTSSTNSLVTVTKSAVGKLHFLYSTVPPNLFIFCSTNSSCNYRKNWSLFSMELLSRCCLLNSETYCYLLPSSSSSSSSSSFLASIKKTKAMNSQHTEK